MPKRFRILLITSLLFFNTLFAVVIEEINFKGLVSFERDFILSKINSRIGGHFDQATANNDSKIIYNLYLSKGIYHFKVFQPEIEITENKSIILTFTIEEIEESYFDEIIYIGNQYMATTYLDKFIYSEKYKVNQADKLLKEIIQLYSEKGFLFCKASVDHIKKDKDHYSIAINIEEGRPIRISRFIFKGNKITKPQILLKISGLHENDLLTPLIIERAQQNLEKKRYIKRGNLIPLNWEELLIEIEEDRMTTISGILGYNNSLANSKLSGYLNLEFLNLLGTDRNLNFNWQSTTSDKENIQLIYHESGPLRFPISADFSLQREEQDSTFIETNFETEVYYENTPHKLGILLGIEELYPGNRKPKTINRSSSRKAGFIWSYNNMDNNINPRKGQLLDIKIYNQWREIAGKSKRKQGLEARWDIFKTISDRIITFGSFNIKTFENKGITIYDYFDLGGIYNLRGFNDNQFSGYRIGWINLELRYMIGMNSRIFIFSDLGYVENLQTTIGELNSFGVGLRLLTRLGLLGIDYGIGNIRGNLTNPLDGIIHFGLETKL